jgi:hypothetical protein
VSVPEDAEEGYEISPTDAPPSANPKSSSTDSDADAPSTSTSASTIADHVLGDQPAKCAEEDKLGFKPYVAAVAGFLTDSSTKTPLTLSIEGVWGSGKSSFMLQLQEELVNRGRKKIVDFNAWQYNPDEGLWAAFIHEFDKKLHKKLSWREKILARLRLVSLRISWEDSIETIKAFAWLMATLFVMATLVWYLSHGGITALKDFLKESGEANKSATKALALVGGAGGTVAALMLFLNQLKDLLKSPASLDKAARFLAKPNYQGKLPLIHQVTRDFKSLVEAYAGEQDVYIFIDDLDRCEYSKAAELMQALLMLLSSAPKIALIIGLDREKVAAAMATKQEKLLPYLYKVQPAEAYALGMEYGQRFIEKFIQLSFILPTPRSTGLKAMVNPDVAGPDNSVPESQKSIRAIEIVTGKDDSETLNTMIEMVDAVFDHNPRNVKQFVNMFRLQAFIANETGLFGSLRVTSKSRKPLTIPQLGKFVVLCMRWPDFVEAASADRNLVMALEQSYQFRDAPVFKEYKDTEVLKPWLRDKSLMLLLTFNLPDDEFSLAGLDFRALSEIAPARVKSGVGQRGSFASGAEPPIPNEPVSA